MSSAQEAPVVEMVKDQPPQAQVELGAPKAENGEAHPPQPQAEDAPQEKSGKRERPSAEKSVELQNSGGAEGVRNVHLPQGEQPVVSEDKNGSTPLENGADVPESAEARAHRLAVEAADAVSLAQQAAESAAVKQVEALAAGKEAEDEVAERAAKQQKVSEQEFSGPLPIEDAKRVVAGPPSVVSADAVKPEVPDCAASVTENGQRKDPVLSVHNGMGPDNSEQQVSPISVTPPDESLATTKFPPAEDTQPLVVPNPLKVPQNQIPIQEQGPTPMQVG